jgi:segregation and condensation protein B
MIMSDEMTILESSIEALLFVSDEPVSANKLAEILETDAGQVVETLAKMSNEYQETNRGIQLREVAGGWRLYTHPAHHELVERYVISWDTQKLSQAALEALAVIAYNQPTTRNAVASIRGVNSDAVITSLIEKGLIKEAGRDTSPGSPILYVTTRTFLESFGLKTLKELPDVAEFAPDEESRRFIAERLSIHRKDATSHISDYDKKQEELDDAELEYPDDSDEVIPEKMSTLEADTSVNLDSIIKESITENVPLT